ncbi:MAG: adenylosuccinate lyase [Candidatus Nanoarchaeia archaeon]|nr:adenylosuccinate lyase [Candidatus Nanoarchaeia archaeon]
MDPLDAISPIDGRYYEDTRELSPFFSEKALMSYRILVEGEYLIALSEHPRIDVREFSPEEKYRIRDMHNILKEDALEIKKIEKKTNHDVKAVEYFMKQRLEQSSLSDCKEWVHFALTSEDVNNAAYALMVSNGLEYVMLPNMEDVQERIYNFAHEYSNVPMLARTHGQPASPTTFGKEFKVFASRLETQIEKITSSELLVKLNGATGNYNAHHVAYPNINWENFTVDFVGKLNSLGEDDRIIKLKPSLITTQIESSDSYVDLFNKIMLFNRILTDFNQDMWRYISDGWIKQKVVATETGSSTMPHKVNPINFENGEGNEEFSNAMYEFFARKLPISRLQRDLTNSTVKRNFGVAMAHSLIAYKAVMNGLGKISVDEEKVIDELKKHPEVIAEAIQTILRREGLDESYEKVKEFTRGKKVTMDDFAKFIDGLDIDEKIKDELKRITPTNYTGLAKILAEK